MSNEEGEAATECADASNEALGARCSFCAECQAQRSEWLKDKAFAVAAVEEIEMYKHHMRDKEDEIASMRRTLVMVYRHLLKKDTDISSLQLQLSEYQQLPSRQTNPDELEEEQQIYAHLQRISTEDESTYGYDGQDYRDASSTILSSGADEYYDSRVASSAALSSVGDEQYVAPQDELEQREDAQELGGGWD